MGDQLKPESVIRLGQNMHLNHNAAACVFAHNHPSGVAEPSQADIALTGRLKDALVLIDVRALDHLIIGETVVSLSERGLM